MGLAEIVQRIVADAERESVEIADKGQRQAAEVRRRAEAEAAEKRERLLAEARAHAQRLSDQRLAAARLGARNQVLAAKRHALDEVGSAALDRLVSLPDREYRELLARQVARRARGDELVAFDAADGKRLGKAFIDAANGLLAGAGKRAELTAAAAAVELGGGVLLIGDGTEDAVTPAGLVADAVHDLEPDIARLLFEGPAPMSGTAKSPAAAKRAAKKTAAKGRKRS